MADERSRQEEPIRIPSPDLEQRELVTGRRPGTRYVRIVRPFAAEFRRRAPGQLVATERVLEPRSPLAKIFEAVRRVLIGPRLPTEMELSERVGKVKGLAIFASDNISSSAYATEEIMRVLVVAGVGALALTVPITFAIVGVLAVVVLSYLQVIRAYPGGGGSYAVAYENLGFLAGLSAAAALLTDYVLTVAVSTAAGVAAITSAFPELFKFRVGIAVAVILTMTILNLRGVRESGTIFAVPTYLYVLGLFALFGMGIWRLTVGDIPTYTPPAEWLEAHPVEPLTLLLILRAFASGSVALTGVEAVSNGVQAFKPPEVRNAQTVLLAMGTLFATIFTGISLFASYFGIIPDPHEVETVVSQIARTLVGETPFYYYIQFSTAVILLLAANTAFNGFPRLASILARDRFLPTQFQYRGDRLAYSTGIIALAVASSALVVAYQGSVTGLIPLYTVGVFLAFTLSQLGLVRHWYQLKDREPGWRWRAALNGLGAAATGTVLVVVGVSKFALGAWMVIVLIPVLIGMMWGIHRHYRFIEDMLTLDRADVRLRSERPPLVVVPIARLDRQALRALAFARSVSADVVAVHVTGDPEAGEQLRRRWEQSGLDISLEVVYSPYRALVEPLLAYIDALHKLDPTRPLTVVLSEYVPKHFWEFLLHNQTALRLKFHLFFRPNTVVIDVPYHLEYSYEELFKKQPPAKETS
jgi:amino acid transporter